MLTPLFLKHSGVDFPVSPPQPLCIAGCCSTHSDCACSSRIFEILPQRIQGWQTTACIAEENNKLALEKIRREQQNARQRLVELDLRHQELSALVERATKAIIAPEQEVSQCTDHWSFGYHTSLIGVIGCTHKTT